MISSDKMTKEDIEKHNPHCPKVPDYWYRILIIGSSASGKTNITWSNKTTTRWWL